MLSNYSIFNKSLSEISKPKVLINTINAHSYNTIHFDREFDNALRNCDILLPDGVSVVMGIRLLTGQKIHKIAGADLFDYEMKRLNTLGGKVFFLGSSDKTLQKIKAKAAKDYPNVKIHSYSPPFKPEFNDQDNQQMIDAVNAVQPDVLFVGMTAPKQEKWAYHHFDELHAGHICCIGAVFDFYAGNVNRAPQWMIQAGLEWFYRLVKEPKRMWKRYLIGNAQFVVYMMLEKLEWSLAA